MFSTVPILLKNDTVIDLLNWKYSLESLIFYLDFVYITESILPKLVS